TRVEHVQCEMEPEKVIQSANEDHQPQSAMVSFFVYNILSLCPIPVSESTTGPGAGLLSFGTIIEPAVLAGDHRYCY
ncbi:MAG: hypothetical protein MJE68_12805, partial [Proteobacteria bacterium]|nr:hypothetical protein [Pseudomonadota bacterium]